MRPRVPALASTTSLAVLAIACGANGDIAEGTFPPRAPGEPVLTSPPVLTPSEIVERPLPLMRPPIDVVTTAGALASWPWIVPGVEARAVTSYDRSGGNDDGFGGAYSSLYESNGEHVILDVVGPGVLRTLWFTSFVDGNGPLVLGNVRFRLDGEDAPRFSVDANALFAGTTAPFGAPLVAANQQSSGGFASWAPIVFQKRLVVTTAKRAGFYQAFYDTFPRDWEVESTKQGPTDAALSARFSATGFSSSSLAEVPLDHTTTGFGAIDVLRFEPTVAPTTAQLQSARIRIWFDGAADPQVDAPLGAFFGSGLGEAVVHALPFTMEAGRFESRFVMPYFDGARVKIDGLAGKLLVHLSEGLLDRAAVGTFHAIERASKPTIFGVDHLYADVTGAGKIVGTVLTVEPPLPTSKQWWEGDLRTFVDDRASPSIHGTGHEDDHLGGWSNEFLERPFSLPMQGCPKTEITDDPPAGQTNARATMYRLYPGIPFFRHVQHSTEHGPGNAREADYSSVTFLYRQPRMRLAKTDTSPLGSLVAPVRVRLAVDPTNRGVELRRSYDATKPRQRARIAVDGTSIGAWYASDTIAGRPGTEDVLFVPSQLTAGKSALEVVLIPEGPFDITRLEAWSVLP